MRLWLLVLCGIVCHFGEKDDEREKEREEEKEVEEMVKGSFMTLLK